MVLICASYPHLTRHFIPPTRNWEPAPPPASTGPATTRRTRPARRTPHETRAATQPTTVLPEQVLRLRYTRDAVCLLTEIALEVVRCAFGGAEAFGVGGGANAGVAVVPDGVLG